MSERERNELSAEELEEQDGAELPPREAMSLIDVGGPGGALPLPEPGFPIDAPEGDDEIVPSPRLD